MHDLLVLSYVQQVPPLTGVSMATMGVSSLSIERYVWNVLCPFNDIHDNNIGIYHTHDNDIHCFSAEWDSSLYSVIVRRKHHMK